MTQMTIELSDSVYHTLLELAQRQGTSVADVLGSAIALQKRALDARGEGGRLLVENGGHVREIVQ
jgi:predicted CopG family antitoxin